MQIFRSSFGPTARLHISAITSKLRKPNTISAYKPLLRLQYYNHINLPTSSLRTYSNSSESTAQSTISGGASDVAEQVAQQEDILQAPDHLDEAERRIWDKLTKELQPKSLQVQDVSGGCGSMYSINVVSERFRGLNILKQQRLVNSVLGEEIKGWHGVQLQTKAP